DEELAMAGAAALGGTVSEKATPPATPAPVAYFPRNQVDAAFAKGAVLLDGAGRNYMIHASRRDKPGMVEVHAKDTDVIYVTGGSVTFVTGGTMVDGKTIEADELRGSSIEGGETWKLAKGDVIAVPNGTPHWFKEVEAPFTY